jgi:ceramide glucosyltransferase
MNLALHAVVGTGLAAAAAIYALCALLVSRAARASPAMPAPPAEPVSVLKPLCGDEPRLYANLRSFCEQEYPAYQILFGLRDAQDPAAAVVARLRTEFPHLDLQLVVDPRVHGTNLKVSNLLNILPFARYDRLVLADSDISVAPDYLRRVTAPLAEAGVGIVTCLYRGRGVTGFWSEIGALFIDDWFAPSVRIVHQFGSTRFGFGSTIALRRQVLAAIGGFERLSEQLADDFWLGELTRRRGLRTVLSDLVVTTDVTETGLPQLWGHELRWLRTIRSAAPTGFAFMFPTLTWPMLAAGLAIAHTPLCAAVAAAGVGARLVLHYNARSPGPRSGLVRAVGLTILRDCLLLAEWAAALAGTEVRWRDQTLVARGEPTAEPHG